MSEAVIVAAAGSILVLLYCLKKEKEKSQKLEKDLQMYDLYHASFKELADTIRARQHEFHNHIQAVRSMHYTIDNYEELVAEQEKYYEALEPNDKYYDILNSEWPVLSGFLYMKFQEADRKEIKVISEVNIKKRRYQIPEYILIEVIGILFDNAMEAALESGKAFLYVRIEEKGKFIIEIGNPISELSYQKISHFFEKGYSSKEGHEGLGLYKLDTYSRKYRFRKIISKVPFKNWEWLLVRLEI